MFAMEICDVDSDGNIHSAANYFRKVSLTHHEQNKFLSRVLTKNFAEFTHCAVLWDHLVAIYSCSIKQTPDTAYRLQQYVY